MLAAGCGLRLFAGRLLSQRREIDGHYWLLVLIPVLLLGFAYAIWQYVRDSRSVGWAWASLMCSLRLVVYLVLAAVFLLPAMQSWDETKAQSKVVVLFDVSGSTVAIPI